MLYLASILIIFCTLLLNGPAVAASDETGWKKVFECNFDTPADLKKWNVVSTWDNANNELQVYRPGTCSVRNGFLYIKARREDITYGGKTKHYVSGRMDTKGKFDIKYGRFDIRFKIPKGKGYWPAFWMLTSRGNWPPEIDWFEILGDKPEILQVTNHYGTHHNNFHPWHGPKNYEAHPDFSEEFHELSGIWNEKEIVCFVDGKKISTSHDGLPHQKMYLVLNLAVGGDLPGSPDETTTFPGEMVVDYVRVYKRLTAAN